MFNPDTWTIIALIVGLFIFVWKTNRDLGRDLNARMDTFDARLIKVEVRLGRVEGRLNHAESRLNHVESRLHRLSDLLTGKSKPQ
ncbi:MAG: hypothetical protein OXU29_06900 [Gammaproteobacteria bacterium]|nr:hypothetical protein [Gammaproteobacteria bacterium]MDD9850278.1 hypothetical protein [Gammaproteobacteria bacterium]